MKKIITLLFVLLCYAVSNGQIKFESLTYEKALQKAKKKKKLLFVQLQSPTCDQCNEVGMQGLNSPDASALIKKECIAVTFKSTDPDWKVLSRQHSSNFGSLFFNSSGDLLHKYSSTSSLGMSYVNELKKAIEKKDDFANFQLLEEGFKQGERNLAKIKELILYKIKFNQPYDQLTTIYLLLLPKDSLYTGSNVAFLMKTAPLLTSRADSLMRNNRLIFDSCWYANPLSERIRLNQLIISKSRAHAINTKSLSFAYRVAAFTTSTYTTNVEEGFKAGEKQILYYYIGIKDTARVYDYARSYAERFLMKQTATEIRQKDSIEFRRLLDDAPGTVEKKTDGSVVTRKIVTRRAFGSKASEELREVAMMITNHTKDIAKLETSLRFIDKAIEINDDGNSYSDKAIVLQKLNRIDEAIQTLENAVIVYRSKGQKADWLIPKIEALKKGTPLKTETDN